MLRAYCGRFGCAAASIAPPVCVLELTSAVARFGARVRQRLRLLCCVVVALVVCAPAGGAQAPALLRTDIQPQPLAQALASYSRQTGLQFVYVSDVARGKSSRGAPAGLAPPAALARLLDGTGLQFELLNERTARIFAPEAPVATEPQRARTAHPSPALEELVVTATKREEPLATVPMSVSVFSPEAISASGIKGISEIAALTPGVEYDFSSQFGSGTLTNVALRGINSNTGQSTTALYMDDAPIHAWHIDTGFSNPYPFAFDLARVEVLRGPQGTLFGTGAEGGAMRFITNQPSITDFDAYARAEVGVTQHGAMSFETGAAAGGPLIDGRLGARVSASYRSDGGYINRIDPFTFATVDENSNRESTALLRVALVLAPADDVRITPSYSYQSLDIRDSPSFYTYLSDPGNGTLRSGKLLRQPATDRFSLGALRVEAALGAATLTSATSYFDRTSSATVDQTNQAGVAYFGGFGNPLGPEYPSAYSDAVATVLDAHQSVFSQEVRLANRDSAAPLTWVAGVFYAQAQVDLTHDTYMVIAPQPPGIHSLDHKVDTDLAAFGDATMSVSRRWHVSLGARVDWMKGDFTGYAAGYANPDALPFFRVASDAGYSLTPRLAVSYELYPDQLLYATAAKGFRAGGANNPSCGNPSTYAPDSVWSYEAGTKNRVLSNRLQLAASVFFARWNGIQETISRTTSCFVDYTTNLGAAVSRGFDFSADALLNDRTSVAVAMGFLAAHNLKTITVGGVTLAEQGTVVGGLPAVPAPWSLAVTAEYHLPLQSGATAYARAQEIIHSHNAGPFLENNPESTSFNTTVFADPATKLLNLHLGWMQRGLDLTLSVLNVLNSQPPLQRDSDAPGSTLQYAYTFRPRTVALGGTRRF